MTVGFSVPDDGFDGRRGRDQQWEEQRGEDRFSAAADDRRGGGDDRRQDGGGASGRDRYTRDARDADNRQRDAPPDRCSDSR